MSIKTSYPIRILYHVRVLDITKARNCFSYSLNLEHSTLCILVGWLAIRKDFKKKDYGVSRKVFLNDRIEIKSVLSWLSCKPCHWIRLFWNFFTLYSIAQPSIFSAIYKFWFPLVTLHHLNAHNNVWIVNFCCHLDRLISKSVWQLQRTLLTYLLRRKKYHLLASCITMS